MPKLSHTAVLLLALTAGTGATATAEEKSNDKSRGEFGVTLQPFAAETGRRRAQPIREAYYAPRAQPVAPPRLKASEENSSEEEPAVLSRTDAAHPMVAGKRAVLRNGLAYPPAQAPQNVKNAMWAANTLRRKPYVWGGGHGSFSDRGYDCSGTVSFALHYAGALGTPMPSSDFCRYGERGRGRWITIYSRRGHTFAVIAGLRLDTTDLRYGGDVGPRWYVEGRDTGGFQARHPVGL